MNPVLAPYMEWAKKRPEARFDLAGSNVLACSLEDLEGAHEALSLAGRNDEGYAPLIEAIAQRYGVSPEQVTTGQGTSGANFQVFAALLSPGDEVIVERPGYDPLAGSARLLGARILRFDRDATSEYAIDPGRIRAAVTSRTRLIVLTSPHNPTGARLGLAELAEVGRIAESAGAHVLVDEVYLDAADARVRPAAALGDAFISTSSLTKSYGLAALRCGWSLSSRTTAARIHRARDVIDGTGSIVTERLATLAFAQLDRLHARAASLLSENRAILREFLQSRDDLECFDPGAGTVVFPRIPGVDDTSLFAESLLTERDTAIVPGRYFEAPGHFRLGIGCKTDTLRAGLNALARALDERE
jgi:aspartate/methionine/tyrosine aminotransferase